jgi:tetratricopeptide (TPR) repeat protein
MTDTDPSSDDPGVVGRHVEPALRRVAALLEVGRAEQALAELSRLPAHLAEDPAAFRLRTAALVALDRWQDVVVASRQGLHAGGPDPDLLADLGLALTRLGQHAAAERALLDGLAIAPHHVVLLCRYALACIAVGQLRKAAALLARAAEEHPYAPIVYATRIDLAFAQGKDRKAERYSREFLAEYPEHPAALVLHGRSATVRGRITSAYGSMRSGAAADPRDAEVADAARELRVFAHPLLAPLRPYYRIGPFRAWLLVVAVAVALYLLGGVVPTLIVLVAWGIYAAYSWVAPAMVHRLTTPPHAATESRGRRAAWWVGTTVALVVGLACAGFSASDLGPAVRASNGDGTPGTIVLTRQECTPRSCSWFGDFTSDDGTLARTDAAMQEGVPADAKVGDRLRAIDTGASDGVFPPTGSTEWMLILIFLVVGVVLLLGWVLAVPVTAVLRRR